MKKLIAALMLVAFFGTTAAIAADVAKGDTAAKKCPKGEMMKDGKCVKETKKDN